MVGKNQLLNAVLQPPHAHHGIHVRMCTNTQRNITPSTQVQTRGSEVEVYPQLHSGFKASLSYARPCFKNESGLGTGGAHL